MNEPVKEFSPVYRNNTLSEFIDESKARLKEILKRLEWDAELDSDTNTTLNNEEQNETQLVLDYEPDFPPSCASENFIVTDADELRTVLGVPDKDVPKRFSDLQLNFSRAEKLSLYEHVIANTKKCTEPEVTVQSLGEGALSFAEIVAQKKRESKKRRRYRRSKPTHNEEVRAVVDLQMQSLQQYLKERDAEERMHQPKMNKKYKSDKDDLSIRGYSRNTSHTSVRSHKKDRSRSRSCERKSHKKSRHRSNSASNSHKHKKSKKYASDRTSSKIRKCRSRSRSKTRQEKHKRRSRSKRSSRSPNRSKKRSRSRNRNKRRSCSRSRSKKRSRSHSSSNNRNKQHHRRL
ncbi:putative RNA-binding protein Luc7-like 2 [Zeugodacus cucurbitae]|uniref:Pre-mRNA-splicing factor 38B n=1 Tax=Zeugodacus cucurbitae TaxID=28588 RepID=A0A0A1XEB3_ZEUCU|nr:putative RNA-binding protein Luc7-like 2 [Zeugodacus cucurbitae]XP_054088585.1 putative RNA-binding protein Luc7-like 2 [Zeugodacus cucurbitae]